jgi:Flp pilus assembly protein TadD
VIVPLSPSEAPSAAKPYGGTEPYAIAQNGAKGGRIRGLPVLLLLWAVQLLGQAPSEGVLLQRAKGLLAEQRWQELVDLLRSAPPHSADLDFYYGMGLAQLGRLEEARTAFQDAARLQPKDKRFPLELAGVEFKQKQYARAAHFLRRALQLDPSDSYGNDFLGTVYYLEGNIEAALKYWNRVGKPKVAEVRAEPVPQIRPELLDRALVFAPASILSRSQVLSSDERLRGLGIFRDYKLDLLARADGQFDLVFNNTERNGFGHNKKEALFLSFRGLPFQMLHLEVFNLRHEAMNLISFYRWDAEKRRVLAQFSAPFLRNPQYRYQLVVDLRGENWNIQSSFQGPTTLLGSLNMRREALGVNFSDFVSGRWNWSAGVEISHRDFRSVIPGPALTSELLPKAYQMKQLSQADVQLWQFPERRLTLESTISSQAGRIWAQPRHSFEKLQGAVRLQWFPEPQGDDYEIHHQLRVGKTFGNLPFDELFMLGVQHDNELWMRGHIASRDGRKGSGPMGRNYFLSNWELDKNAYRRGPFDVKAGPFVETGKITDPIPGLGSHKWLWDLGAQAKVRIFGIGVVFSYGKDLRSGNNAFYVSMLR